MQLSSAVLSGRRAIGSLTGDNGKIGLECTAALIAPQFLITAAHCVYIPVTGYLGNLRCAHKHLHLPNFSHFSCW